MIYAYKTQDIASCKTLLLSAFPVLIKADLIFKSFQKSPLNSSTIKTCTNPDFRLNYFMEKDFARISDPLLSFSSEAP